MHESLPHTADHTHAQQSTTPCMPSSAGGPAGVWRPRKLPPGPSSPPAPHCGTRHRTQPKAAASHHLPRPAPLSSPAPWRSTLGHAAVLPSTAPIPLVGAAPTPARARPLPRLLPLHAAARVAAACPAAAAAAAGLLPARPHAVAGADLAALGRRGNGWAPAAAQVARQAASWAQQLLGLHQSPHDLSEAGRQAGRGAPEASLRQHRQRRQHARAGAATCSSP
jgi:hypothetical protein